MGRERETERRGERGEERGERREERGGQKKSRSDESDKSASDRRGEQIWMEQRK